MTREMNKGLYITGNSTDNLVVCLCDKKSGFEKPLKSL